MIANAESEKFLMSKYFQQGGEKLEHIFSHMALS